MMPKVLVGMYCKNIRPRTVAEPENKIRERKKDPKSLGEKKVAKIIIQSPWKKPQYFSPSSPS